MSEAPVEPPPPQCATWHDADGHDACCRELLGRHEDGCSTYAATINMDWCSTYGRADRKLLGRHEDWCGTCARAKRTQLRSKRMSAAPLNKQSARSCVKYGLVQHLRTPKPHAAVFNENGRSTGGQAKRKRLRSAGGVHVHEHSMWGSSLFSTIKTSYVYIMYCKSGYFGTINACNCHDMSHTCSTLITPTSLSLL